MSLLETKSILGVLSCINSIIAAAPFVQLIACMSAYLSGDSALLVFILPAPPWTPALFWVRWVVSKREALMLQNHIYFSLSILGMAEVCPDAGISSACVWVCMCVSLSLSTHHFPIQCQESHSAQAHHFDEFIRLEFHAIWALVRTLSTTRWDLNIRLAQIPIQDCRCRAISILS